jgi:DNA ligase D-like protein (predicted 3'-phosphoesterase)
MPLKEYKKKRNLKESGEPSAKIKNSYKSSIFVVHEHHATHLHWDLRLEMDGVLKSWAVPKSPPESKGTKRLAIQVEDHPLDYAEFKGTIPEGNYGAGEVKIWDNGNYELLKKYSDKFILEFHGKLKGNTALSRQISRTKSWFFSRWNK